MVTKTIPSNSKVKKTAKDMFLSKGKVKTDKIKGVKKVKKEVGN